MNLSEKLVLDFNELNDVKQREVLDFVQFLKENKDDEVYSVMDEAILENKDISDKITK